MTDLRSEERTAAATAAPLTISTNSQMLYLARYKDMPEITICPGGCQSIKPTIEVLLKKVPIKDNYVFNSYCKSFKHPRSRA